MMSSDSPPLAPDHKAPAAFGDLSAAIYRLGRAHRALAGQLMREVGLHPEQGAMMMHLWEVGPVRQTVLAAEFSKDSAGTTRTVQRLEQAGYVRRRRDPSDGRATLVESTTAGNALKPQVRQLWARLEDMMTTGLTSAERDLAISLLGRLADASAARVSPGKMEIV